MNAIKNIFEAILFAVLLAAFGFLVVWAKLRYYEHWRKFYLGSSRLPVAARVALFLILVAVFVASFLYVTHK
jgi:hypothetical protein